MADTPAKPKSRRWRRALGVYLVVLALSHVVAAIRAEPPAARPNDRSVLLRTVDDGRTVAGETHVVYQEYAPADGAYTETVVLLHGSPGSVQDFGAMGAPLGRTHRVIVPDLPGFGLSERDVPDYSAEAHACYVLQLLDALDIESAHLVGFSMGGAVAIRAADLAPGRVRSVTLIAAIGVQELELFGSHRMNRVVHGAQLGVIRAAAWGIPHFGLLRGFPLGIPYARNFYDTDQRPLRGMLARYAGPMLIVHGDRDFLVPPEVAVEHHRIVPQSELQMLDDGHFVLWTRTAELADTVDAYVSRVAAGDAPGRASASPERLAVAGAPWNPARAPEFVGVALLLVMFLLATGTLISEDLTCIGAGLLVAQGRLGLAAALFACWLGNFVGDVLLYLAGRWLGRAVVRRAPLRWVVSADALDRASDWFQRRGARAIFISRFVPGLRLPTYTAAGVLRTNFPLYTLYFAVACALWTPLIVGFAAWAGARAYESFDAFRRWGVPAVIALVLLLFLLERVALKLLSHRGRRQLVGSLGRLMHWEFWPRWAFYPPVALYVAWLALRHRSLALVTAVNPAIPAGGLVGESKSAILSGLGPDAPVPPLLLVPATQPIPARMERALAFVDEHDLAYPIVLKPDVGERGEGVLIAESEEAVRAYLAKADADTIVQAYAPGEEFGVFYYRLPGEGRGRVFSIAEKRLPALRGDGRRTLEELILDDPRAVRMAATYMRLNAARAGDVPADGEEVTIARIGTHCLGAVFLDAGRHRTPELEAAFDRISRGYDGFWFGRYDVRTPDVEAFRRGEGFAIVELNGLTAEAAHIYDPKYGLLDAYRVLFEQWRLAFEIARRNRERGAPVMPLRQALERIAAYFSA